MHHLYYWLRPCRVRCSHPFESRFAGPRGSVPERPITALPTHGFRRQRLYAFNTPVTTRCPSIPSVHLRVLVVLGCALTPTLNRTAHISSLHFPLTDIFNQFSTNCHLIKSSFFFKWVLQICHAAVSKTEVSHYRYAFCDVLVFVLSTHTPGQQHAVGKQGDQTRGPNGNVASPGSTSTTQPDSHSSSSQRRPTPTTSTVPRPRSGWCGFPDPTGGLPGPLGRILGR
ncbi:hypothetical protein EDB92DRAFT_591166 [Lactarius akahatsu]|uniref:Uncharacterized protein n=1 Tax=Lactarius akahatsu TaxID=416441 RepID=A0AAD4LK58_9AGAM|nr:hypothetical protein EDB92DRAFT_591166 [Lactarius akahatsu]